MFVPFVGDWIFLVKECIAKIAKLQTTFLEGFNHFLCFGNILGFRHVELFCLYFFIHLVSKLLFALNKIFNVSNMKVLFVFM